MLSTHWDGMADFEGHLALIADELEKMEAADMKAIEDAPGWDAGESVVGKYTYPN